MFIIIFATDVYFERFFGANIFGWGAYEINNIKQPHGTRVMSFFKDEPIAGAYLNGFIFLICGYLLSINKNKKSIFAINLIISLFFIFNSCYWRKVKFSKGFIWYGFVFIFNRFY